MSFPDAAVVQRWVTACDDLVASTEAGSVEVLDDLALVGLMQQLEQTRNRLAVVDHHLVAECEQRGLPERSGQGSPARFLAHVLRLSPGEAARRVRAAGACGPRQSFTGEALGPVRPVLAAALRAGGVSAEQADVVVRALGPYDNGYDPADVEAGEKILVEAAATMGPQDLKVVADHVGDQINPDGTIPDDHLNHQRRHFTIRPGRDGTYVGSFRLTGTAGAKLIAILEPLSKPRTTPCPGETSRIGETSGIAETGVEGADAGQASSPVSFGDQDTRTLVQRRHDAVEDMCDRLLRSDTLPDSGGTPATVIVTIGMDQLLTRTGAATTTSGARLTAAAVMELAGQAELVPAVLSATGDVLALGRTRRIASPAQTHALTVRDAGCSFPGCDHPPQYCERHHIIAWAEGGPTNLDNLTLLCRYHHHHFATSGWTCRLTPDGLPAWTPPPWIDPARRPLINHRIHALQHTRTHQPHLDDAA